MIAIEPKVATGLDVLASEGFARLKGRTVGLIANQSTVDRRLRHAIDLLRGAEGVNLVRLFGPEHGLRGELQDMQGAGSGTDPGTGLPIVSLYGEGPESLRPKPADLLGLDCLIFDVQDVGARYYTFAATMLYAMEVAAEVGCSFLVLDRPNPLGGLAIEGPSISPGFESFVGAYPMPIRHGMTVGELALLFKSERGMNLDLEVVSCSGWRREMFWNETGLIWIPPSPNMPTPDTVLVYPGGCLLEGTNFSEGRGTTRPFENWGAPWLEGAIPGILETIGEVPGAILRPNIFQPVFHKHAGVTCFGVQPHMVDPRSFRSIDLYLMLITLAVRANREQFAWRLEPYEFVDAPIAIDLLFGSSEERVRIEDAAKDDRLDLQSWTDAVTSRWASDVREFESRRNGSLLYAAGT